jgi:hypothetical protein
MVGLHTQRGLLPVHESPAGDANTDLVSSNRDRPASDFLPLASIPEVTSEAEGSHKIIGAHISCPRSAALAILVGELGTDGMFS